MKHCVHPEGCSIIYTFETFSYHWALFFSVLNSKTKNKINHTSDLIECKDILNDSVFWFSCFGTVKPVHKKIFSFLIVSL